MFITDGLPVHHVDVSGIFWSEVDTLTDYDRLQAWVFGKSKNISSGWDGDVGEDEPFICLAEESDDLVDEPETVEINPSFQKFNDIY